MFIYIINKTWPVLGGWGLYSLGELKKSCSLTNDSNLGNKASRKEQHSQKSF